MRSIMDRKDLRRIARRVHDLTCRLADGLEQLGYGLAHEEFFDTIRVDLGKRSSGEFLRRAVQRNCNLRVLGPLQHRNFARRNDHA